jgi:Cdc6-like AAA superfamily ATPase
MMFTSSKFEATLDFESSDPEDQEIQARRIKSYSISALKAALPIDKIYVQHPDFTNAVTAMDRIFQIAPEVAMPHGLRLVGPPGVGKTAVMRYFQATLPTSSLFLPGFGVIGIRAQPRPRTGQVVSALLRAYRYPFATGTGKQLYIRRHLVFDAIKQKGTRLIFIDEAQNLVRHGRQSGVAEWESDVSEFFREIMCHVGLILAGSKELDALDKSDPFLASRVTVREHIRPFEVNAIWIGFLRAFAKQCLLFDVGSIAESGMAKRIHLATEGNLRSFKRLLTEAVLLAVDQHKTTLDLEALGSAFRLVAGSAAMRGNPFV